MKVTTIECTFLITFNRWVTSLQDSRTRVQALFDGDSYAAMIRLLGAGDGTSREALDPQGPYARLKKRSSSADTSHQPGRPSDPSLNELGWLLWRDATDDRFPFAHFRRAG